jgi:hypothetical protein
MEDTPDMRGRSLPDAVDGAEWYESGVWLCASDGDGCLDVRLATEGESALELSLLAFAGRNVTA